MTSYFLDTATYEQILAADAIVRDVLRNATRDDLLVTDEILTVEYVEESFGEGRGIEGPNAIRIENGAGGRGGIPLLGTAVLSAFAALLALVGLVVVAKRRQGDRDEEGEAKDDDSFAIHSA